MLGKEQKINRKISLRLGVASDEEAKIYPSRIKSFNGKSIKVLAPLDIIDLSTLVKKSVTIVEEPIGGASKTYNATISDYETIKDKEGVEDRLLVLGRPRRFTERSSMRVDANFPITIKSDFQNSVDDEDDRKSYEGLATNLSVSGLLVIMGLDRENELSLGRVLTLDFELPSSSGDPLIVNLNAQLIRKYRLEFGETSKKYAVGLQLLDVSTELEEHLSRYVLTNSKNLEIQDGDTANVTAQDQVLMLKDEVDRLQEQLRLASNKIKRAEEAKLRSDTIIIQLTRRLNEQSEQIKNRASWIPKIGGRRQET